MRTGLTVSVFGPYICLVLIAGHRARFNEGGWRKLPALRLYLLGRCRLIDKLLEELVTVAIGVALAAIFLPRKKKYFYNPNCDCGPCMTARCYAITQER